MSNAVSEAAVRAEAARGPDAWTLILSPAMALLALGHLTTDLFSSAVPTLQPILAETYGLSLAQAGLLGGMFMFSSSVLQLPFGLLSDRFRSRLFSVLGPLGAGVFFSSLGLATGFPSLLALTFFGGMSVAAFHPQSTTEASRLSGERRGLGVAFFITAGTFGLALGPPYFSAIVERLGFDSLPPAMAPAVAVSALLLWRLPRPTSAGESASNGFDRAALLAQWRPLALHYGFVVVRSVVQLGIGQFLTLYLVRERAFSLPQASFTLALFFLSISAGSLIGGSLADRIGGKRVIEASMIGAPPFLALFLATDGRLSLAGLFVGGVFLMLSIPVNVVMAQELVPSQGGAVTALMMGFAWGVAGISFVPLLGWTADRTGLEAVFWGLSLLPLAGLAIARRLPAEKATD